MPALTKPHIGLFTRFDLARRISYSAKGTQCGVFFNQFEWLIPFQYTCTCIWVAVPVFSFPQVRLLHFAKQNVKKKKKQD